MMQSAYCVFETSLGWCGIAWSDRGNSAEVTLFRLPKLTPAMAESAFVQSAATPEPTSPPAEIAELIKQVGKHLHGDLQDFRGVAVSLDGVGLFARRVYDAAREIPAGETRTYGELAKALGRPAAAQEVGMALARNRIPLIIPCHRVVAAGGRLGGFSAPGGRATKQKLLAIERASFGIRPGQLSFAHLF